MNLFRRNLVSAAALALLQLGALLAGTVIGALTATASAAAPAQVSVAEPGMPGDVVPEALRGVGIDQRLGQTVPLGLVFRDETGREVRLAEYAGKKPILLTLNYYECPMLCTVALGGLVRSLRVLTLEPGKDFTIVTVSINPLETPPLAAAKKRTYLEELNHPGAAEGWHFLTGDAEPIRKLAAAVGFRYTYDAASKQYAHAAGIMILTPQGKIARYFYGIEYAPRDLRLGLIEASSGAIGTFADQILLFCFHYDPATGRYGAAAIGMMRLGGAVTVLVIVAFIMMLRRRESRRTAARPA